MSVTATLATFAVALAAGWGFFDGVGDLSRHMHVFGPALGNLLVGGLVLNAIISAIDFARSIIRLFRLKPSLKTILRATLAGCLVAGLVAFIRVEAQIVWIYWPVLLAGILGGFFPMAVGTALKAMGAEQWPLPGYFCMPPLDTSGMTAVQKKEAEDRRFIARMPVPVRTMLGL